MKAAALQQDGPAGDLARHQLATVSRHPRDRKPRDIAVGKAPGPFHRIGQGPQPRAEHDRRFGPDPLEPRRDHSHVMASSSWRIAAISGAFSDSRRKALSKVFRISRSISLRLKP